ncbi:hypothetical protein ACFQZZ_29745 [Nocardia sp. GCM10030253]|uniref:Rv0361 family membrane protein n=1 Tax=Nocardia sp. GCM10030253 TaxID=3273404 RepID=UPI00362C236F
MTYPPDGQPPYGPSQYPEQQGQQGYSQPGQQPYGYPQQGGQGYPPPGYPPEGYPRQQGYPPPPRTKRTGLFIGLLVLVLIIAGGIAAGVVLTVQGRTPLASDEKKIEVAIRDFYDTLGKDGFRAAAAKACAIDRAEFDSLSEEQKQAFDSAELSVTIDRIEDIVVTGDRATAHIVGQLTMSLPGETPSTDNSTNEHMKKEDGKWRVCSAESGKN